LLKTGITIVAPPPQRQRESPTGTHQNTKDETGEVISWALLSNLRFFLNGESAGGSTINGSSFTDFGDALLIGTAFSGKARLRQLVDKATGYNQRYEKSDKPVKADFIPAK
jgi:hypothetical protein